MAKKHNAPIVITFNRPELDDALRIYDENTKKVCERKIFVVNVKPKSPRYVKGERYYGRNGDMIEAISETDPKKPIDIIFLGHHDDLNYEIQFVKMLGSNLKRIKSVRLWNYGPGVAVSKKTGEEKEVTVLSTWKGRAACLHSTIPKSGLRLHFC